MSDEASLLDFALAYARAGWRVFPCQPRGKKPLVTGGFKSATCDEVQIVAWWTKWPDANIGIATGAESGLLVVDLDGFEGKEAFKALAAPHGGEFGSPWIVRTGKGCHLYFALQPGSHSIKSSASGGLDIRADSGYVIAQPSVHSNGKSYELIGGGSEAPSVAPPWLCDFARTRKLASKVLPGAAPNRDAKADGATSLARRLVSSLASPEPYSATMEARLRSALQILDANDRERWVLFGFALHDLGRQDSAWEAPARRIFDEWSATCPDKYGTESQDKFWASCGVNDDRPRVTVATIFHEAQKAGWTDPASALATIGPAGTAPKVLAIEPEPINFSQYLRTDAGNAQMFLAMFSKNLRYVEKWGCWFNWDGTRWVETSDVAMVPLVRRCTEEMLRWAAALSPGDNEREAWVKHALASQKEGRLRSMIWLSKGEAEIRSDPADFDRDPMLLGCPNGTLDLRTGELRQARREDRISKSISVPFDPATLCPRWLDFLDWAMCGDREAIGFVQRLAGYALTGEVREELMLVFIGGGANGKSTLLMVLLDVMGEYAGKAQSDLLVQGQGKAGAASPDVAALHGKRLVVVSETEDGCMLSEARVKDITSNERISARRLHHDPFDFMPTHKIILATNHRPRVRGTDNGMWRRLAIVDFAATVGEKERDPNFRDSRLRPELVGILGWMVEGCKAWQRDGLRQPASIRNATAAYRSEMDLVAQFVSDRIEIDPAVTVPLAAIYDSYRDWCQIEHTSPLGKRRFGDELDRLGHPAEKSTGGARVRRGLRVRPSGILRAVNR